MAEQNIRQEQAGGIVQKPSETGDDINNESAKNLPKRIQKEFCHMEADELDKLIKLGESTELSKSTSEKVKDLPDMIREKLTELRDEKKHSHKIPEEKAQSCQSGVDKTSKVFAAWWTPLINWLELGIDCNVISDEKLIKRIGNFIKKYKSVEKSEQVLKTKKDIRSANRLIDLVLKKLPPPKPQNNPPTPPIK